VTEITFVGTSDAFGAGGRRQSAVLLRGASGSVLIDCGTTTGSGLHELGVSIDEIDVILISHFHADHFGGIPLLLLAALYEEHRKREIQIAGPPGIEARVRRLADAMGHGLDGRAWAFPIRFVELPAGVRCELGALRIRSFATHHNPDASPHGLLIETATRRSPTPATPAGSTGLPRQVAGHDLFICECTYHRNGFDYHLSHEQAGEEPRALRLRARDPHPPRQEMADRRDKSDFETATTGSRSESDPVAPRHDLAEHALRARAGGARQMVGQTEQRVAAEQRECDRLRGARGHAVRVERLDRRAGHRRAQRAQERGIARASAADEQARDARAREVLAARVADRLGAEREQRRDEVVERAVAPARDERLGFGEPIALAPRRLRRRRAQEVVVEQLREQRGVDRAAQRAATVGVHALGAARRGGDHAVDQRVGRADVERDHVLGARAGGQPGDVRDPAQVQRDAALAGSANAAKWKNGASGAPSPPAATSRGRKSRPW
jgi:hypothetical protein